MRKTFTCLVFLFFLPFLSYAQDTFVGSVTREIDAESIERNLKDLESFPSRYCFSEYGPWVAEYLKERMSAYGFEVTTDSFYVHDLVYIDSLRKESATMSNVICKKRGSSGLDKCFVLGAHYDCISIKEGGYYDKYELFAPGADDNASGVAVLLEIARIWDSLSLSSFYDLNIEFYTGEENGFLGSSHRMEQLSHSWRPEIISMMNLDMVGYNLTDSVDINVYDNSLELTELTKDNVLLYSRLNPSVSTEMSQRSDSYMFYAWGCKAVYLSEHDFSPYYHTLQDSSKYLDKDYMREIGAVAMSVAMNQTKTQEQAVGLECGFEKGGKTEIERIGREGVVLKTEPRFCPARLRLFDKMGREVFGKEIGKEELDENGRVFVRVDFSRLAKEVYIVEFIGSNGRVSKKFLRP